MSYDLFLDKLSNKKHIIWDWNGTLLDDLDHAVGVVNSLLIDQNLNPVSIEAYKDVFDFPVINYYKALGFDFEKAPFEKLCEIFVERFMAGVPDLKVLPHMQKTLEVLHQDSKTQSVLSATDQENLEKQMELFNIRYLFDNVYGIDNKMAASKVARGLELINNSHIDKSHTVLVGDTTHDLEVGKAMGIEVILVGHGHHTAERLCKLHDQVLEF